MKLLLLSFLFLTATVNCWANETYSFNCKDSSIQGQINYSMVLSYDFSFNKCSGTLSYNPRNKEISSVDGQVLLKSIQSNCPVCNRVVLSRRLLHASLYPYIQYHAGDFTKINHLYKVTGILRVHGITKAISSYFSLRPLDSHRLLVKGSWIIPRKKYDIIWSKYLDRGGVVVADDIIINWHVIAHKT